MHQTIERRKEILTPPPRPPVEERKTIAEAAKNFREANPDLIPKAAMTLTNIAKQKQHQSEADAEPDSDDNAEPVND